MRQEPALAGVTFVALTGYGQEEDRERSREAGFAHHLIKPVDTGALLSVLAEVVPFVLDRAPASPL
jgi:CheY-like chemotaxis protein